MSDVDHATDPCSEPLVAARPILEAAALSFDTGRHRVALDCDASLKLPARVARCFAVVVHEAVDNALRHAFPNRIDGRVWVRLFHDRGRLRLTIRDNGVGMPDFDDYRSGGRARIMEGAASIHAYARMGAGPFTGALVSITCAD